MPKFITLRLLDPEKFYFQDFFFKIPKFPKFLKYPKFPKNLKCPRFSKFSKIANIEKNEKIKIS